MTILHKAGCAMLGLLLWSAVQAADSSGSPQQYDIELLIFQNLVDNDGGEVWPIDYSTWYDEAAGSPVASGALQTVKWLPDSSLHMQAERAALDKSSRYRTLAYLAWRQPVVDRISALPLELPVSARANAAWVSGTVRVAVERYLHLYLDLQLHLPASSATANETSGVTESTMELQLPEIRLTEQRRMRSNEIHYFDNPRFGVIALITPYEPPPEPVAPASVPAEGDEKPVTAP